MRQTDSRQHPRCEQTQANFEMAVLAILHANPESIDSVRDVLQISDFLRVTHQKIYSALLDLRRSRTPTNELSVANLLDQRGQLSSIGGPGEIQSVLQAYPAAPDNLDYYVGVVLANGVHRSTRKRMGSPLTPVELKELFHSASDRLLAHATPSESPLRTSMRQAVQRIDVLGSPSTEPAILAPFWSAQEGDQIVLAGPRNGGKTNVGADIALGAVLPSRSGQALGGLFKWNLDLLGDGRIAVLDGENSKSRWETTFRRLLEHQGDDPEEYQDLIHERIIYLHAKDLGLRDPSEWTTRSEEVAHVLIEEGAHYYILDSTGRFWGAPNLSDMAWVQQGMAPFAEACKAAPIPISGLVLAHVRRPSSTDATPTGPLGSSTQENYADGLILLERNGNKGISLKHMKNRRAWWIGTDKTVMVDWPKNRFGFIPTGKWATAWSHEDPSGHDFGSANRRTRTHILQVIEERGVDGIRTADLAEATGVGDRQVRRHLKQLRTQGKIEHPHRGVSVVSESLKEQRPSPKGIGVGPECPKPVTDALTIDSGGTDTGAEAVAAPMSETTNPTAATGSVTADTQDSRDDHTRGPNL